MEQNLHRNFQTEFQYIDRETKAEYVFDKYHEILIESILDVGADECYLKQYLPPETTYLGIGLGGNPDQQVDLEEQKIPFPDNSFNCVLCLDTLEHIENIHAVFDDLCRVASQYVIVTLPNPWASFYNMLRFENYKTKQPMKFYGLPFEKPEDRHKWFFSSEEAEKFILYRAGKNNMEILQMDYSFTSNSEGYGFGGLLRNIAFRILFQNRDLNTKALYDGTLWAVLRKEGMENL